MNAKRNLIRATLATKGGTPLAKSNTFPNWNKTAASLEVATNAGKGQVTTATQRKELRLNADAILHNNWRLQRTHETEKGTIVETYTSTERDGTNEEVLYLEWLPTTDLLKMREKTTQ